MSADETTQQQRTTTTGGNEYLQHRVRHANKGYVRVIENIIKSTQMRSSRPRNVYNQRVGTCCTSTLLAITLPKCGVSSEWDARCSKAHSCSHMPTSPRGPSAGTSTAAAAHQNRHQYRVRRAAHQMLRPT